MTKEQLDKWEKPLLGDYPDDALFDISADASEIKELIRIARIGLECQESIDQIAKFQERLHREVSALSQENITLKGRVAKFTDALEKAYRFMKEAKAMHYPHTTNSFVDDWIKDYETRAALSAAGERSPKGEA